MPFKQFSDQALLEMSDADGSGVLVKWSAEWVKMFNRYRALEDKFEALANSSEEKPDDIPAICKELVELSGDGVCYECWTYDDRISHRLYSVKIGRHTPESKTLSESIAVFRGWFENKGTEL